MRAGEAGEEVEAAFFGNIWTAVAYHAVTGLPGYFPFSLIVFLYTSLRLETEHKD